MAKLNDKRVSLVLAVVVVALGAFIYFYERFTLSTGDVQSRESRALPRFVRKHVTKLELQHGGKNVVLVRTHEEGALETEELGTWNVEQPVRAKADNDAVDALLGALEWLDARRSLEGLTHDDITRFGLDRPRVRLWFTVANERIRLVVGKDDPRGEGVYVQAGDDATRAFVAPKDFFEAVTHDASHFRTKTVVDVPELSRAEALEIRAGDDTLSLRRDGSRWDMTGARPGFASVSAVQEALRALLEVRAQRFVAETVTQGNAYGFDAPELTIRVEIPLDVDHDAGPGTVRPRRVALIVGRPCEGHADERYVRNGDGPVVCALSSALDALRLPSERFREMRLSSRPDEDIDRIEIESGSRKVIVQRDGSGDTFRVQSGATTMPAAASSVAAFARAMREARASSATFANDGANGAAAARITLGDSRTSETVSLVATEPDAVVVARSGEGGTRMRFPLAIAELFDPVAVKFRDPSVAREDETRCTAIRVVRRDADGQSEEHVAREGERWRVMSPVSVDADHASVLEVLRRVAALDAVRFVAERARPEHGLSEPRLVATLSFAARASDANHPEAHDVVLHIGAITDGGAFATAGNDPTVFVAPAPLVDALTHPMADRNALASSADQVERISIWKAWGRADLHRDGDGWKTANGSAPDEARTNELLLSFGGLRAAEVAHYGPPTSAEQSADATHVEVTRRENAAEPHTYTFIIGATTGSGEDARVFVWREGLPVVYRFVPAAVTPFQRYTP